MANKNKNNGFILFLRLDKQMNYPSPRHWLLLDAICRQHSLTKAADFLALSQSAASQALKELEQRLGQPLFFTTRPATYSPLNIHWTCYQNCRCFLIYSKSW